MSNAITWLVFAAVALTVGAYVVLVVLGLWYLIRATLGR